MSWFGQDEKHERDALKRIEQKLDRVIALDEQILANQGIQTARSLTVRIGGLMGNTVLAVGKTAQATAHEWSGPGGTGTELKFAGPISWTSSDTSVVTVDANGLITAVAPSKLDANNAPIPVDITATDTANGLSNPSGDATITDVEPKAQSLTVTVAPI